MSNHKGDNALQNAARDVKGSNAPPTGPPHEFDEWGCQCCRTKPCVCGQCATCGTVACVCPPVDAEIARLTMALGEAQDRYQDMYDRALTTEAERDALRAQVEHLDAAKLAAEADRAYLVAALEEEHREVHRRARVEDGEIVTCRGRDSDGPCGGHIAVVLTPRTSDAIGALVRALGELADLMDEVRAGNYTPDSFTTQPARAALAPFANLATSATTEGK